MLRVDPCGIATRDLFSRLSKFKIWIGTFVRWEMREVEMKEEGYKGTFHPKIQSR